MNGSIPLANELAALGGQGVGGITREDASRAVQSLAFVLRDSVPNAGGAGASIINSRGRRESSGATDPVVLSLDKLQYELGQGPCLSAWAEQRVVIIQDIKSETRWPEWTAAVADLPVRSVLSAPLTTHGRRIGALKIYSQAPLAFHDETVFLIEKLAAPAAVLLGNVIDREALQEGTAQLAKALANRDLIAQAQGIIMERMSLGTREALDVLLDASREEDKPLHEVARDIIDGSVGG